MLPNLRIVLFFISFIVKSFKKVFIGCFTISCIIVYSITIILDVLDKMSDCIKFGVIKHWSTWL